MQIHAIDKTKTRKGYVNLKLYLFRIFFISFRKIGITNITIIIGAKSNHELIFFIPPKTAFFMLCTKFILYSFSPACLILVPGDNIFVKKHIVINSKIILSPIIFPFLFWTISIIIKQKTDSNPIKAVT